MKVKHATAQELANNLSAKRRHPYMYKLLSADMHSRECQPELAVCL